MSEKYCIFCGKKPENKNLEHVIPQWLIRMTGRQNKNIYAPHPDLNADIPFMRFTFPACTKCNTRFSKMEAAVKPVLERVLAGQSISGADASLLMDWFDKVRIGMWLSNMYYDPELKQKTRPHFFIADRVAKSDRMLSIRKINFKDNEKNGIYCTGTMTNLFKCCPSAFTMVINDYYFFNASNNNLVSSRVGFPGLCKPKLVDEEKGMFCADFIKGTHKVANPIIQTFVPDSESINFYQPIYKDYLKSSLFPMDDYILEHSYDSELGLGGRFCSTRHCWKGKVYSQRRKS